MTEEAPESGSKLTPAVIPPQTAVSRVTYLRGEEHPSLVALWDNADDDVYDEEPNDER